MWEKLKKLFTNNTEDKMMLRSRDLGNGMYQVCGVNVTATSHAEALRKYRRALKEHGNG
jgi:hypothetical protein